jgi:hypothetical protein
MTILFHLREKQKSQGKFTTNIVLWCITELGLTGGA